MGAYVYMLSCADGSYYIGSATGSDLSQRIAEHDSGVRRAIRNRGGRFILCGRKYFDRITDAIAVERELKGWSRAKKAALITGDWTSVRQLSKRRGGSPKP